MWSKRRNVAPQQGGAVMSVQFNVAGMHCGTCGLTIDEALEEIEGVERAHTSFKSGSTAVTLLDGAVVERVTNEVMKAIGSVGYTATVLDG